MNRISIKQYAAAWHVSERTVRRWIERGAVDIERTPTGRIRICEPSRGSRVAIISTSNADDCGQSNN